MKKKDKNPFLSKSTLSNTVVMSHVAYLNLNLKQIKL